MKIAMIGLGKMGFNLALNFMDNGHDVVVYNRTKSMVQDAIDQGLTGALSLEKLAEKLDKRRVIWLMVHAGNVVDGIIDKLIPLLNKNDIIIDGGNSNYKDTLKRFKRLEALGIERSQPGHETHISLLGRQIVIIEGLRLGGIDEGEYYLIAMPISIIGAEVAPARAVLIDKKPDWL